jgi:Cu(I)/Ag(I) efflux system membrane protein CusA/SilA
LVGYFLERKLVVAVLVVLVAVAGLHVTPFDWDLGDFPQDRVPVDAIPDIGENQQIVFTEWAGRSPRDIEDQVTYPLTTALMGIPGVRTVRSFSMFGFSSLYVIFHDDIEFYWSRSRVLEKLSALPANLLPDGVTPVLGPDATALGQVFWYTLEGRDREGNAVGGFDLHELRSIQDWTVRYALQSVSGVSEVASVGGHVREYQVDVDPEAMVAHGVQLQEIVRAVAGSNLDVGARTLEINRAEYVIRGLGAVQSREDLEATVVAVRNHTPILVRDVGRVALGPANRRGVLDVAGAESVGGVVVMRYGENPLEVIEGIQERIRELAPGLPQRTLEDGRVSRVTIVPFYDRTGLIHETLSTLSTALVQQILITVIVVLVMLRRFSSSLLIASILPLAVLATWVAMKVTGVDANIMSLAGIAIAIGTMVDMGIVLAENINAQLERADPDESRAAVVRRAAAEVAPAVWTSLATTVVSFLPVFALTASEGKLFRPLAFTKTYALTAAFLVALVALPVATHWLASRGGEGSLRAWVASWGAARFQPFFETLRRGGLVIVVTVVSVWLALDWMPLGREGGGAANVFFVAVLCASLLGLFFLFARSYPAILRRTLRHKAVTLSIPLTVVFFGLSAWLGFDRLFSWLPRDVRQTAPVTALTQAFPGFGREFMPSFDEGSFLYMPTTMPHASLGQALEMLQRMDAAIATIPEVDDVVGKLGRVDSALDPAPISMIETLVTYRPEYGLDDDGRRVRLWRSHIRSTADIWEEIVQAAQLPGLTSAPVLQPINARLVMLQSGLRAPMGLQVRGPDLATIEEVALRFQAALRQVPSIRSETVFADRVVGKPYLELALNREAISRHGLTVQQVQEVVQVALGGRLLTRTIEGRERYPVRVRYMREERDSIEAIGRILVPVASGGGGDHQIPLADVTTIRYVRGPQVIRSEDAFLTGYVLFDRQREVSEVEAVEQASAHLQHLLDAGELQLPAGVSYSFTGSYQNQVRSEGRLKVLIPLALTIIFLLLYLQFRSAAVTFMVFAGVVVAISGGMTLLWLYGQPWFLDVSFLGTEMRQLFQVAPVHLSVAVWVGFIALLGIATDDGVVLATYLTQRFGRVRPDEIVGVSQVRELVVEAACRRVRPALMTTATTVLALLPVVTSQGRGADVMVPMALPVLGGMTVAVITLFVVPVLFSWQRERDVLRRCRQGGMSESGG